MPSKKDSTKRTKNEPFYKAFVSKDAAPVAPKRRAEPSRDGVKRSAKPVNDNAVVAPKKSRKPVNDSALEPKAVTKRAPKVIADDAVVAPKKNRKPVNDEVLEPKAVTKRAPKVVTEDAVVAPKKSRKPVNDEVVAPKAVVKRTPKVVAEGDDIAPKAKRVAKTTATENTTPKVSEEAPKRRKVALEVISTGSAVEKPFKEQVETKRVEPIVEKSNDFNTEKGFADAGEKEAKAKRERNHKFANEYADRPKSERFYRDNTNRNNDRAPRFNEERNNRDERPVRNDRPVDRDNRSDDRAPRFNEERNNRDERPVRNDRPVDRDNRSDDRTPRFNEERNNRDERPVRNDRPFDRDNRSDDRAPRFNEERNNRDERPVRNDRPFDRDNRNNDRAPRFNDERPVRNDRPVNRDNRNDDRAPRFNEERNNRDERPVRNDRPFDRDNRTNDRAPRFNEERNNRDERPVRNNRPVDRDNRTNDHAPRFNEERNNRDERPVRNDRPFDRDNRTNDRAPRFNEERNNRDERPVRNDRPVNRDERPMKVDRTPYDRERRDERPRDEEQPRNPRLPKPVLSKHIKPLHDESMWGEDGTMRLNKYVANAGIASRRAADDLIAAGHVTVNGQVVKEMGHRVKQNDTVAFKGKTITPIREYSYILLNKPKNCITTADDERGRLTVLDLVADATTERLYPVGRLDRNTTGLLILTNDGELAKRLMHPSHKIKKVYYATLDKGLTKIDLDKIREGLKLEDGVAEVDDVDWVDSAEDSNEVGIQIHIGKNRIVRRIFEHLGYNVERLDRVLVGSLTKKDLPRGKWRHLTPNEIRMLKHF